MNNKKVVLVLSGGLDSTTLLYKLLDDGYQVFAISFDYGQRHSRELEQAQKTTASLAIPHKIIDLTSVNKVMGGSSLTRPEIETPKGHYADETMKITVVPNRNMIMLSVAVAWAVTIEANKVFFGAHAGDHDIYPDCRKEFVDVLSKATEIANYVPVTIEAPFIDMDKGDIAILGKQLNVDYSSTHTCYVGLETACGKCGACVERKEAFLKAEMLDPIQYTDSG